MGSLGFNGSNTCVCASTSNIQTLSFLKQRLPKMKVVAVLVIMVAVAASAFASCPNPPTVVSINVTAYMGHWYQLAVSENFVKTFEKSSFYCTTADYTLESDGTVKVNNSGQAVLFTCKCCSL